MPFTTLITNEVKDSAGAEVEFSRISTLGRTFEFSKVNETPNLPVRLYGAHKETGSGSKLRRSSMLQVLITSIGVDGTPVQTKARVVLDTPVGNVSSATPAKDALAMVCSLVSTLATNTFLYDGTGNGAKVLLNGEN